MSEKNCLYKIFTLDGQKVIVEAGDADEACAIAGIPRDQCRKWYPFPLKVVLTEEEKTAKQARFEYLKLLAAERRALRKRKSEKPESVVTAASNGRPAKYRSEKQR